MELKIERKAIGRIGSIEDRLVGPAERNHLEARPGAHGHACAVLVVPVVDLGVDIDGTEDEIGKPVASREGHRPLLGHGDVEQTRHVDRAQLGLSMHSVVRNLASPCGHDASGEAPVAGRRSTRVQVDAADQPGVDRRRPERRVEKQWDRDVVIDVLRPRRRSPADVHVGLPIGNGHGARQKLQRSKRLAEGPRDVANPVELELDRNLHTRIHLRGLGEHELLLDASPSGLQDGFGGTRFRRLVCGRSTNTQVDPDLRWHRRSVPGRRLELGLGDRLDDDVAECTPSVTLLHHALAVRVDADEHLHEAGLGHLDARRHLYARKRLHPRRHEVLRTG